MRRPPGIVVQRCVHSSLTISRISLAPNFHVPARIVSIASGILSVVVHRALVFILLHSWILGSSIRSVVPSPSVKGLDHCGAEEPNYQPDVEIQLISRPGLPFATSVVSRRENGVDDDQRNIRSNSEEHDHVKWPRDAADRVNFLDIRSRSAADPSQKASKKHHKLENSLFRFGISLIAADNIAWSRCIFSRLI